VRTPFGTWPSPLAAAAVASQGLRLGAVAVDGGDVYWLEGRPAEGGRNVIVRRRPDGTTSDVVPPGFNVRTRVHEYGGGAYVVSDGEIYFSNFADQRIYHVGRSAPAPTPVTPAAECFYADFVVDASRRRLIAVREDHTGEGEGRSDHFRQGYGGPPKLHAKAEDRPLRPGEQRPREPVNSLVSVPLDDGVPGEVLASGYDFYSTPRLSPDGQRLSWLAWRHPQMPWDGTELWVADVAVSGALVNATRVAGGEMESIYQPGWSPDGVLCYASDRDGWWRLYRGAPSAEVLSDPPPQAEFGRPHWVFGTATWSFAGPSRIVASYTQDGRWHLALIDLESRSWRRLDSDLEPQDWLTTTGTDAVLVAASATMAHAVVRVDLESGEHEILRHSSSVPLDPADISIAEPVDFPTADGSIAHAFYYPPRHRACTGPEDERPPLIAIGHGGPTTATSGTLDPKIQYWTTRGFAVVDVNYSGSSGYGRAYRQRLSGRWGIVDVSDMVDAARHLVSDRKADPHRLAIRGGSAGGYTALAALTFHPGVFSAGASYYGISDIEVLARETHKFESRYLDLLIGPYPERRDLYVARSPIHFVDRIACPLILFQGLEDKVVPPDQSQRMADAARAKGLPVAYLTFEGEQHGFRKAETIVRSLEAELAFYGAVFGFEPADEIEPLAIDNLPQP
jgi:dipeptidyl aminopeptidase/acylaminoacyl peptidase